MQRIRSSGRIRLLGEHEIAFDEPMQLLFMHARAAAAAFQRHALHARSAAGKRLLREEEYYSIGGGFVVRGDEAEARETRAHAAPPYPFNSGDELLALCREHGLELYELMLANERTWATRRRCARSCCTSGR